uniref:Uncharacterized protein n=1 Tax=Arion vulgaris TaxID=1028688 RepID=A0A0B7A3V3_9EUPU
MSTGQYCAFEGTVTSLHHDKVGLTCISMIHLQAINFRFLPFKGIYLTLASEARPYLEDLNRKRKELTYWQRRVDQSKRFLKDLI